MAAQEFKNIELLKIFSCFCGVNKKNVYIYTLKILIK